MSLKNTFSVAVSQSFATPLEGKNIGKVFETSAFGADHDFGADTGPQIGLNNTQKLGM